MSRIRITQIGGNRLGPRASLVLFLPGATLVGLGLMVLWMPELLRFMVAGLLLLVGFVLLAAAWQMRGPPAPGGTGPTGFTSFQQRVWRRFH